MFNNNKIEVTSYGITSGKVKNEVSIAHISDLHEKKFGTDNINLFDKVERERPDVIAVTGDIVAHENQKSADIDYTVGLAKGLSNIAPTFFVTGNHEKEFDEAITDALSAGGVTVVRGGIEKLLIKDTTINISGINDLTYAGVDIEKAVKVFSGVDGFNIFLTHQPQIYELCLGKNMDLILAGHTHAGQIRIPVLSRLYMYGQGWFPKFMQGEFTDGDTTMIISRGLGSSGYPTLRINNPPDLVMVYLSPL